jgi:hypothetical protein
MYKKCHVVSLKWCFNSCHLTGTQYYESGQNSSKAVVCTYQSTWQHANRLFPSYMDCLFQSIILPFFTTNKRSSQLICINVEIATWQQPNLVLPVGLFPISKHVRAGTKTLWMWAFKLLVKSSKQTEFKITKWCFIKSHNVRLFADLSRGLVVCVQRGWTK